MKKFSFLLVLAIAVLSGFFITSCKKEKTEVIMVVKNWTLDTKTIAGLNIATDCEKGSKLNFKSDGTYSIYDSCNSSKAGTWKLAEDGKTLTLDNITAYSVIENSVSKLVIEMQVGDIGLVRWSFN